MSTDKYGNTTVQVGSNYVAIPQSAISDMLSKISSGQLTPQQAASQLGSTYAGSLNTSQFTSGILSSLIPSGTVTVGGKTGYYTPQANFIPTTTQVNQSVTTGAGTTTSLPAENITYQGKTYNLANPSEMTAYKSAIGIGGNNATTGTTASPTGSNVTQYAGVKYDLNDPTQLQAYKVATGVAQAPTGASPQGPGTTTTDPSTGLITNADGTYSWGNTNNTQIDQLGNSLTTLINNQKLNGNVLAPGLQITPALVSQFLGYAHSVVDPQTQQAIKNEQDNINQDLTNQAAQYGYSAAGIIRDYGTSLYSEQNTAGGSAGAGGGQRTLNEQLLTDTANQQLGSLASSTAANIGSSARSAAQLLGVDNSGGMIMPNLNTFSVSPNGGARGTSMTGSGLGFNYNPSTYQVGSLESQGNTNLANQQANYLTQYTTLAGQQSAAQPQDLVKQLTGLPANLT